MCPGTPPEVRDEGRSEVQHLVAPGSDLDGHRRRSEPIPPTCSAPAEVGLPQQVRARGTCPDAQIQKPGAPTTERASRRPPLRTRGGLIGDPPGDPTPKRCLERRRPTVTTPMGLGRALSGSASASLDRRWVSKLKAQSWTMLPMLTAEPIVKANIGANTTVHRPPPGTERPPSGKKLRPKELRAGHGRPPLIDVESYINPCRL